MKKILSIGVILLFIGVGFAPSLFADVETISEHQELIEFTVEFYGLDKLESHVIALTRENADRIDDLFEEVKNNLNNATTNFERITILNEFIGELDNFDLLGDISIEDVKKITTDLYKEQIDGILEDADINYNCLIVGRTTNTCFFYSRPVLENIFFNFDKYIKPFTNLIKNRYLRYSIELSLMLILTLLLLAEFKTVHSDSTICYGEYYQLVDEPARITYADGWVWTIGKNGIVEFDGGQGKLGTIGIGFLGNIDDFYIGARNFCGIRLLGSFLIDGKRFPGSKYIGFASEVSIG